VSKKECWLQSYLTGRAHFFSISAGRSEPTQLERICTQQTVDSTTSHMCHRRSVPEHFQSPDHKPGADFPHHSWPLLVPFILRHLKQYFLWRLTTGYYFIFSPYPFYISLFSTAVHFTVSSAIENFWLIGWLKVLYINFNIMKHRMCCTHFCDVDYKVRQIKWGHSFQ